MSFLWPIHTPTPATSNSGPAAILYVLVHHRGANRDITFANARSIYFSLSMKLVTIRMGSMPGPLARSSSM